jgi:hypothetical protein
MRNPQTGWRCNFLWLNEPKLIVRAVAQASEFASRFLPIIAHRSERTVARIDPLRRRPTARQMGLPPSKHVPHLAVEADVTLHRHSTPHDDRRMGMDVL